MTSPRHRNVFLGRRHFLNRLTPSMKRTRPARQLQRLRWATSHDSRSQALDTDRFRSTGDIQKLASRWGTCWRACRIRGDRALIHPFPYCCQSRLFLATRQFDLSYVSWGRSASLSPNVTGGKSLTLCHPINTPAQLHEARSSRSIPTAMSSAVPRRCRNGNRNASKDDEVKEA